MLKTRKNIHWYFLLENDKNTDLKYFCIYNFAVDKRKTRGCLMGMILHMRLQMTLLFTVLSRFDL